jgi:hypothetical protein
MAGTSPAMTTREVNLSGKCSKCVRAGQRGELEKYGLSWGELNA